LFENFRVIPNENISIEFTITGTLYCFCPHVKREGGIDSDETVRKAVTITEPLTLLFQKEQGNKNWAVSIFSRNIGKDILATGPVIDISCF
jgi:hypothetical protein